MEFTTQQAGETRAGFAEKNERGGKCPITFPTSVFYSVCMIDTWSLDIFTLKLIGSISLYSKHQ